VNTTNTRYRTLKSIFHERGKAAAQTEMQARRNGHSTYLLNEFNVGEHPLFYLADRTALASFERIMRRERHIEQLSSQLPSIAMQSYLLDLAVRSIVASDRIEGVHTTRQLISEALTSGDSEDPRAKRAVEFVNLLKDLGAGRPPSTVEQVRSLYDTLLEGHLAEEDRPDGALFRTKPVVIHDNTREIHRAPDSEVTITANVQAALDHALDPNVPALFSAIAAHFMVEYTHPFYDGNGRLGRYLLVSHLGQTLTRLTTLTLPSTLNIQKSRYYKAFSAAEEPLNYGEVTGFLHVFLGLIEQAQEHLVDELESRDRAWRALGKRIAELEGSRTWTGGTPGLTSKKLDDVLRLLYLLGQVQIFRAPVAPTSSELQEALGVTAPTLRDRLKLLQGLGFVEGVKAGRTMRWSLTEAGTALLGLPAVDDDEE
jgi:bacterial regulatory protein